jgi:hypothetical protein
VGIGEGVGEAIKKAFFFAKKNQKTFVLKGVMLFGRHANQPKVW